MGIYLSAGVYFEDYDYTQRAITVNTTIAAMVYGSPRGSLGVTPYTSIDEFKLRNGTGDLTYGFGHDTARAFFTEGTVLIGNRVINGATYGGTSYFNDREGKYGTATLRRDFPYGLKNGYAAGGLEIQNIVFTGPVLVGQKVSMEITDGEDVKVVEVDFTINSNETLAFFANEIVAAMAFFGSEGQAFVVDVSTKGTDDDRIITIYPPSNTTLIFQEVVVTPAASEPVASASVEDQVKLFDVFAENPGSWSSNTADGVGVKITNLDQGTKRRAKLTFSTYTREGNIIQGKVDTYEITSWESRITFSGAILPGNVINMRVNGKPINPVIYSGSVTSDMVMKTLIERIYEKMDGNPVLSVTVGATNTPNDDRIIEIRAGHAFEITDATVTEGIDPPSNATIDIAPVVAQTGVLFFKDSDSTLQVVADALTNLPGVSEASVKSVPNGRNNDREINLVAAKAGPDAMILEDFEITGTAGPGITVTETLTGVLPSGRFTLEVYTRANVRIPVEKFPVSLNSQVDGNALQTNISHVINKSAKKSLYIRIYQPEWSKDMDMHGIIDDGVLTVDQAINWLDGGDDGAAITSGTIIQGWGAFENRDTVPARMLLNAGYTTVPIHQKMASLAEKRRDCIAILDMPSEYQQRDAALDYRNTMLNVNTSYAAIYTPDLEITDMYSDEKRWVPPSGYVGAAYARTDRIRKTWFAPAGIERGKIPNVSGLRYDYSKEDRDLLEPANINCIISKGAKGIIIWGQETLQASRSVLSNVAVRRLLIALECALASTLDDGVFDPNSSTLRHNTKQKCNAWLEPVRVGEGISKYEVICDGSNNTDPDSGELYCDIYMSIVVPGKAIIVRSRLLPTGANFDEYIQLNKAA